MDKPDIVQVKMPRQAVGQRQLFPAGQFSSKLAKISQLFGAYYGLLLGAYRGPTGGKG